MSSLPLFGRLYARQILQILPRASIRHVAQSATRSANHCRYSSTLKYSFYKTGPGRASRPKIPKSNSNVLKAAISGGALGTAAFIKLSEKDNDGTEHTAEGRMLQASREELAKTVDEDKNALTRLAQRVVIFLDVYIWEPLCTGFRFCHLVVIFVPVILSVPAIWIGRRQPDQDNERSGTLWWYNFLVWGMETAGPAFIKVCCIHSFPVISRDNLS